MYVVSWPSKAKETVKISFEISFQFGSHYFDTPCIRQKCTFLLLLRKMKLLLKTAVNCSYWTDCIEPRKTPKSATISNKSSKMWFQTNISDISFTNIPVRILFFRFVIWFFRHSQNVIGGVSVSFEKSEIRFVIRFLMQSKN